MEKKLFYWDAVSEEIGKLLLRHLNKDMDICEIGFASGHFLEFLYYEGYSNLSGIEVRTDIYQETMIKFSKQNMEIDLMNKDVLEMYKKYDAIYTTGLIQCFDEKERGFLLNHLSQLAPVAIYIVPEIEKNRNKDSREKVAVAGCREFSTGNIAYELSNCYSSIYVGKIDKSQIGLNDNFLYYVCERQLIR
ncbi:MAG: iron-containing alcohol dehydrogenase [Lachnospiraceae bacterium]|jgi:cyclopropane fatty-acyl-phospholipid synthase-like methyltransferase|nr:iron-containing alcohol dehydrogenase [Lachnospiraceae bacterium]